MKKIIIKGNNNKHKAIKISGFFFCRNGDKILFVKVDK